LEWKQEIDRVYRELVKIEQEVEIARKQGGDGDGNSVGEECRRHIELIVEMCKDIKGASHHEVRKVFAHAGESLEDELAFIRKNEIRINKQNNEKIMQLGQITKKKKSLAQELRSLISKVKNIDYENKELQTEIQTVQNSFDEKMEDLGGQGQLKRIKENLHELKKDIRESSIQEGLMMERIFNFKKNMDQGKEKNHLYDELDEEQKQSEFTEADLKIDEKASIRSSIEFDKNTP
jgi:chromosome segregation ATPase